MVGSGEASTVSVILYYQKKKKKEDKNKKKNGKPKTEASNENIIKF